MTANMKSDYEIVEQWKKHHKVTRDGLARQYKNTEDCQAFYAGDLMDFWIGAQSTDQFGTKKRSMVQINKVKPYVNAVKGFFAQNRRVAKYSAAMPSSKRQELYSMYANGLGSFIRRKAYADQKETQMDGDLLINGYAAMETAMSYSNGHSTTDPNGQVIKGRKNPLSVGWDPFSTEINLLDSRWAFYEEIYDLDDAIDLFQDSKESDFEAASDDQLDGGEGGYKFYARGGRYNKIKETAVDWADEKNQKVKVYFYQWYQFDPFFRCENPVKLMRDPRLALIMKMKLEQIAQELTEDQSDLFAFDPNDEILTFDGDVKERLEALLEDSIEIYEYRRKTFYSAVVSKEHVFTKYRNPCQQGYTIKFKTGDYDSKNKIWVGMVNGMKEPTLYYNKAFTELMFIIGANSKGGVYIEENAVDDVQAFEQQYAKTDAVIVVEDGALSNPTGPKIKTKKEPQTTTGYEQIIQAMGSDIQESSTINKEFLGSTENKNETGILYKRRIRQVMSTLACYVDSINLFQLEDARLLLDFMRIYAENNAGGLFSIIGANGKENFLQISRDKLAAEYDVKIDEAPQTDEEKQEYAEILSGMADKLMMTDVSTAKVLLAMAAKYLPLEYEDKQTLQQILMPKPDQIDPNMVQNLIKQVKMLTDQHTKAALDHVNSQTTLNLSKAGLDKAKVGEVAATIVQKKADAVHKLHEGYVDETMAEHERNQPPQPH